MNRSTQAGASALLELEGRFPDGLRLLATGIKTKVVKTTPSAVY